jgi:hypothetical protein
MSAGVVNLGLQAGYLAGEARDIIRVISISTHGFITLSGESPARAQHL